MSKEIHLSLVICPVGRFWLWYLIDHLGKSNERWLSKSLVYYATPEVLLKELNKISANLLPETGVYKDGANRREFIGPLEMFHDLKDQHSE